MDNTTTELRVRFCPKNTHNIIEKYKAKVRYQEGRKLNKDSAVVELIDLAAKLIKL